MVRQLWLLLLFANCCLSLSFDCSCVDGSWNRPRDDAIEDDFKYSTNIYVAVVSAADCKCYPQSNPYTRLDCLGYVVSENNTVMESVGKRYECLSGGGFLDITFSISSCEYVKTKLVSTATVDSNPDLPPITYVTGEDYCDLFGYSGEGCQLSNQPCFYNVTVGTVYKGNLTTGDVVVTRGPDVNSCYLQQVYYGRVLTLGVEYVVGIGGVCNPINQWSTLESYSESEVALLEKLQQQCAEDPSSCNSAKGSHLIYTFLLPLVILLSSVAFII